MTTADQCQRCLFATNLRFARRASGMTQAHLAGLAGVDTTVVSRWERGRHLPSPKHQQQLAAALDVSVSFFYLETSE
jgi:transcriptional regulator with XRE-family HTH domain